MARIICLANSYKGGGQRCVAGIDIDTGKWVRPVPHSKSRAITSAIRMINGKEPQILDVIEIPLEDYGPDEGCQPENRLLKPGKWKIVGRISAQDLLKYCEDDAVILHSHDDSVLPAFFIELPKSKWRSLQLVHNSDVRFQLVFNPYKQRDTSRVCFHDGKGYLLDLSLTDAVISDRLRKRESINRNCILTVSLTTPFIQDGVKPPLCYKLVAGVVELQI